jgi:hypothetical protein
MLSFLIATGTVGKVAWVVVIVLLLALGGAAVSRMGGARHGQDLESKARRDADRNFRRPPNEGDLL